MVDPRCQKCGQLLSNPDSVALGYGPDCARDLGLTVADALPQRCSCCWHSAPALRLLYGAVGLVRRLELWDGSFGWVDTVTGEVLVRRAPSMVKGGDAA